MQAQPTGTVTFLFTDLEGSTKLWEKHPDAMRTALARHDAILRGAIKANNGYIFKTIGDAFCATFAHASDAANAAIEAQKGLVQEQWGETGQLKARMALHTGEAEVRDNDYFGQPVNRVARILSAGHGNQVLLSQATAELVRVAQPKDVQLRDLGKHRLKDLARPEQIYQLISPGMPVSLERLRSLPSPMAGGVAALGTSLVGLVSFRAQTRSSSEGLGLSLLSPVSLYLGLKGLVIELATLNEYLLLVIGLVLLALTVGIGVVRWRQAKRQAALNRTDTGRVSRWVVNQRTLAFLGVAAIAVLGSYAYQQYLWRVALPIPDDAVGFAITREASAATFKDQLADTLYSQGQTEQIVVRELPVKFDASDTERARELGKRIGAEAVIIYRLDEAVEDGPPAYIAYVVFTDPSVELMIGASPDAGSSTDPASMEASAPIQVKEGIDVPVLRTETLNELVNAAAGIIAYEDDRLREAITYLELARPQQPDAANTGLIQFYLGNAYNLNGEAASGAAALESAATFYEARVQAGARLGPQDMLILVKTYTERGRIAQLAGDWETALTWYQKALDLREELVARASGLEQPSAVHATYARLFTLMADAYRGLGKIEDQKFWQERAADEIEALAAESDPNDPYPLVREGEVRFFLGDCVGAIAALDRALTLQPDNVNALTNLSIISLSQERVDRTVDALRQIVALRPDDVGTRMLLADVLMLQAVATGYFEPAYAIESETMFREVIALDPTNELAYERIAGIEELFAQGAMLDTTALVAGDNISVEKSQVLWSDDPERQAAAVDALSVVIETRRVLASELERDDPESTAAVADAYAQRQGFVYGVLLDRALQGDGESGPAAASATPVAVVDDPIDSYIVHEDAAQIREWTDEVLADPNASHSALLLAWSARVASFERVWSWYAFMEPDEAKAAAAEQEYRAAVEAAVAFGESQAVTVDEIGDLREIYFSAMLLYGAFDGDQAAQDAYYAKILQITEREQTERVETTTHLDTFCREVQETAAGGGASDPATALSSYDAALSINPSHVPALLGAADALFDQGDAPSAIARAESATQLLPAQPEGWGNLAVYRLAAGDQAGAEAAYAQFITQLAARHPQERMATLSDVLGQLDELLTDSPERAAGVAPLLAQTAVLLDGMNADGARTYQYASLYTAVGKLALEAGAPADAERWLRQSLAIDPLQPEAHVDLVVAVIAQGRDASVAIAAAIAMVNDPAWSLTSSYDLNALLDLMDAEAQAVAGEDAVVAPLRQAIDAARPS